MCIQLTLALFKPDIASNHAVLRMVERRILEKQFVIVKRKEVRWQRAHSEAFYAQHRGRFFHRRLVEFMTCGPIIALLLAKRNAIADWRKLMGPTKTYKVCVLIGRGTGGGYD